MDNVLPGDVVPIVGVEVIGEHRLRLAFRDGVVGDVDFSDHDWTGVFEPLRDPRRFAQIAIEGPTIVWPNDGLDMAPEPLYERARRRQVSPAAAA